jgi:hypothetical protein
MHFAKNYDLRHYRTTSHWWQMQVSDRVITWLLILANIALVLSDYIE